MYSDVSMCHKYSGVSTCRMYSDVSVKCIVNCIARKECRVEYHDTSLRWSVPHHMFTA